MFPNTRISLTITTFGQSLINQLPHDYNQEELEAVMAIVITVWNAVTIDAWNKTTEQETLVLTTLGTEREGLLTVKRLIKRKKTKFANDLRAVGEHWVREESDGGLIFGCEARANIENIELTGKH
jgi:hypothetical protein